MNASSYSQYTGYSGGVQTAALGHLHPIFFFLATHSIYSKQHLTRLAMFNLKKEREIQSGLVNANYYDAYLTNKLFYFEVLRVCKDTRTKNKIK